jgi:serine/threonine protein kinase
MLYQICQAAYSCHELHTIHRDLKPENVLLTRDRTVKLCDFGVARQLDENSAAASFCGTPPYMAPEVFITYLGHCSGQPIEGYTYKSEVWSIGCMLLDMATVKGIFVSVLWTYLVFCILQHFRGFSVD